MVIRPLSFPIVLKWHRSAPVGIIIGCANVNAWRPGDTVPWHFGNSDFTVSIGPQEAEAGGAFEFVPDPGSLHEERYNGIRKVLGGGRSRVRHPDLEAGDVHHFKGRFALHRVTLPEGRRLCSGPDQARIDDLCEEPVGRRPPDAGRD